MAEKLRGPFEKLVDSLCITAAHCRQSTNFSNSLRTSTFTIHFREGYVLRKLSRCFTSMESLCERWKVKINLDQTQDIYFSHGHRPAEAYLTLKWRNIPFVNNVRHLGVILEKKNYLENTRVYPKYPDWDDNEIYAYNN
jgi:hypothetical protein